MTQPKILFLALCIVISGFASSAQANAPAAANRIKKVLKLSVGRSDLFLKDVPKISLSNGPLAENETSIDLAIDKEAFLNLFSKYKNVKEENGFFREARNFRDGLAEFRIRHVDGTITTKAFSLAPNAPNEGIVELHELLLDAGAVVTGTVDVYKCFSATTCVLEKTRVEHLFVEGGAGGFVKHNFRGLVVCRDARIEGGIDHPEIQRLVINRAIARRILKLDEIITAKSKPVLPATEFQGFNANLENFGSSVERPLIKLEVLHENHTIKLFAVARRPEGVVKYNLYNFERCNHYP